MKKYKYADTSSAIDMTLKMYDMLTLNDAEEVYAKLGFRRQHKRLGAENFGELAFNEETSAQMYYEALACPTCGSHHFCKNGKGANGTQRYICKECGKTFSASSKTLSAYTSQDTGKWMLFITGLLNAESCANLSKLCNISEPTAFAWRIKVFAALEHLAKDIKLSGAIFADDTRIPYNLKGNHGKGFFLPRKARSRGHQNTIKNVQSNTICVLCAIDSADHCFSQCIGFGNPSGKRLSLGFQNKLDVNENTILVTDGAQSYKRVVEDYSIPYWEKMTTVKRGGKRVPNIQREMHIQKINSYHSRLKNFLRRFKSVASRYLPGYLLLFDYIENNKQLSTDEKARNILKAMVEIPTDMTLEMLADKYITPVSNGPETELWERKVPRREQQIYIDWIQKTPIKDICAKHHIKSSKIYTIKNKVNKHGLHDKIMERTSAPQKMVQPQRAINERNWEIFLLCYRDGLTYSAVGRQYGITKQAVHQIVSKIMRRPESAAVRKFDAVYPEKSFAAERAKKREAFNKKLDKEFKLLRSDSTTLVSTYALMAKMNNTSQDAVEGRLRRGAWKDTKKYHWNSKRKEMSAAEYQAYTKEVYPCIYADYLAMEQNSPELSKSSMYAALAQRYDYSVSHLQKILRDQAKGEVSSPKKEGTAQEQSISAQETTYHKVMEKQEAFPRLQKAAIIRMVAKEQQLSYRTAQSYYYRCHRLMQRAACPGQEQIDEAV